MEMKMMERVAAAGAVFTPSYPVQQKDMFSGRENQINRTIEALTSPGRHPVIFGQRGVGKTSLANLVGQVLRGLVSVKVSCDGADTFATIWNRVFLSASVGFRQHALGFMGAERTTTISLGEALGHDVATTKSAEIAALLGKVNQVCVVVLDEFDKVNDQQTKAAFADLIKILSDTSPKVTIILVGVAANIGELIGEHPSIERNLVQIELPLMADKEIRTIFEGGMRKLEINVAGGIVEQVPMLAGGYPHYAHLLGLCAVKACAQNDTNDLTRDLFDVGCEMAIQDAIEKYRDAYAMATATTQLSRYPEILSACGYANSDERGVFRATDVVEAMNVVFKDPVTIQAVVPGLGEFLTSRRGSVLQAVTVGKRKCYRFRDPMMRPFCRLKARELLRRVIGSPA